MNKYIHLDEDINEEGKWKVLSSEYLFRRPWLTARKDIVELPNGQINDEYYVLEYPDWVNVIAITEDGDFVMERQYRHGLGVTEYEICAGVIEKGETPLEAAKRELQEETGFGGGTWEETMLLCANPSSQNNISHCFTAVGVKKISGQHLDRTEAVESVIMPMEKVRDLLLHDKFKQALMAAPLWRYFALNKLL